MAEWKPAGHHNELASRRKEPIKAELAPPIKATLASESDSSSPPTPSATPNKGVIPALVLITAGCISIGIAIFKNNELDQQDLQQTKLDNSINDVSISLSRLNGTYPTSYKNSPKQDRTSVWVFGVAGVFLIALGLICWSFGGVNSSPSLAPTEADRKSTRLNSSHRT